MCVQNPPTFAPSPLRGAWGLVENRAALLRRRRPVSGRVAPWAGLALYSHGLRPRRPKPAAPRARWRFGADRGLGSCGRISDTRH
jgi:hypothetical protein